MRENGVKDGAFALLRRKALADYYLGRTVEIAIDRPIGYVHAKKTYTLTYPLNYGYLPGVIGGDGEELDVYLMGVETPVSSYTARIIGVVHRENDEEDKLVAAPEGRVFHQGEIAAAVEFQEKYYKTRVEPLYPKSCGALVYRETEAGRAYLCLLQRRSGTYSVPKGHMEAFETETQTARRDVLEETGLDLALRPEFRAELCYDLPGGKRKRLTLFLAACEGEPRLDEGECVSGVWLDARRACERLPVWYGEALERAERLRSLLENELAGLALCSLKDDVSRVGGGSFPEQGMPTTLVCIHPEHCSATRLKMQLLSTDPPLVGRLEGPHFQLDPRTMEEEDFADAARVLKEALLQLRD